MDKDIIKGLLVLFAIVAVIGTIVFLSAPEGGDKANCIASALKEHVPLANIDKICRLTETRPTR